MKKYFKIAAPFHTLDAIQPLKEAGAHELYCGYVDRELSKKWPLAFNILNRRGEDQSFDNYEHFRKAAEAARTHGLPVHVTLNGLYTPEQYPLLHKLAQSIDRLEGVQGLIVADLGLLLFLKRHHFKKEIHISTGGTCFNASTLNFYENLGAKRVILDRQLTSGEIGNIIARSKAKIDTEIFIVNEPCGGFIDGFCTFFHCFENKKKTEIAKNISLSQVYNTRPFKKGCYFYHQVCAGKRFEVVDASTLKKARTRPKNLIPHWERLGCGVCGLFDLKDLPIKSLKIVGRGNTEAYTTRSIKFIAEVLRCLFREGVTGERYRKTCKRLCSKIMLGHERHCTKEDCYFPAV